VTNIWSNWLEAMRFGAEVQQVMGLRMLRIAAGGPRAATEMQHMVAEKLAAAAMIQNAAIHAVIQGQDPQKATDVAFAAVKRRVRANRRRLSRS